MSAPARFSFQRGVPESATIGARLGAFVVDLVILFLLTMALGAVLIAIDALPAPNPDLSPAEAARDPFVIALALLEMPLDLAYFTICEAAWGRTAGKLALGLRVVSARGLEAPTLGQAAMRNLLRFLWLVPLLSLAFLAIDWYLMRVGEMDQRIGDLAARTYVVRDGAWWPPEAAPAGAPQ